MLSMTWHTDLSKLDAFERKVEQGSRQVVEKMATDLADLIKNSWSPISPSAWGETPAVVTGALNDSVKAEQGGRTLGGQFTSLQDVFAWTVHAGGPDAPHAEYLEPPGWLNRPFWQDAIDFIASQADDYYRDIFNG